MRELNRIMEITQDQQSQQIDNFKILLHAHIGMSSEIRRQGPLSTNGNRDLINIEFSVQEEEKKSQSFIKREK